MANDHDRVLVKDTLRVYYGATKRHKTTMLLCFFTPFGVLMTSVVAPYLSSHILASLAKNTRQSLAQFIWLAIVLVVGVFANRIGMAGLMRLQANTMADLHDLVFERLHRRGARFYTNNVSGKLISDAIDFVNSYTALTNATLVTGLSFLVTIFFGLVLVCLTSWLIGLFLLVFISLVITWTFFESRRRSRNRAKRLRASKDLTSHLSDTLVNAITVKTFANEKYEMQKSKHLNAYLRQLRLKDWQWTARSANNRIAVVVTTQLLLMLLLISLSRTNPAVLATGIFAFTYIITVSNKLFDLNTMTRQIEEALLEASPITDMLSEEIEIQDIPHAQELRVTHGAIEFQNVDFDYQEGTRDNAVFKKLSLNIKPGERIGLVGSSGGGKSTLTRLLLRFEDIQAGTITIDGQDISTITQASLRRNIAYVPQEPLLFHRPIAENISYAQPDTSLKDIKSVAKKAHADEFIQQLPHGYDTLVGERGVKLSGGQRQRVAIARAMLKDAPILVLDEATSALDSESEVLIQDALWKLMEGRTAIVIAHRLSTIQKMDRIIVLDKGAIAEQGSHKQLLAKKGIYANLWGHQSGGFIEE